MSDLQSLPRFNYENTAIQDIQCVGSYDNSRLIVTKISIGDKSLEPTKRFWNSLMSRFGFGLSIFKYFSHKEVFDRINERESGINVRLTTQVPRETESTKLLSVSDPDKQILFIEEALAVLNRTNAHDVEYLEGVIITKHNTRHPLNFEIAGDQFTTKLTLETPIDGYGKPMIYISAKCETTGANLTAYTKKFQSGVILGSKGSASHTLERAIDSYNNEDGFSALKQRLGSSNRSWASVHEVMRLARLIWKIENQDFQEQFITSTYNTSLDNIDQDKIRNDILIELYGIAGDLRAIYSVAQIDSISLKRMKALPSKCKVYDLIKFASKLASNKLLPEIAKDIQMLIGELISEEFDMESSCEGFASFEDFAQRARPRN